MNTISKCKPNNNIIIGMKKIKLIVILTFIINNGNEKKNVQCIKTQIIIPK